MLSADEQAFEREVFLPRARLAIGVRRSGPSWAWLGRVGRASGCAVLQPSPAGTTSDRSFLSSPRYQRRTESVACSEDADVRRAVYNSLQAAVAQPADARGSKPR